MQIKKFRDFGIPAVLLVVLTFVIWVKVTTDIFFIDALLFCILGDYEEQEIENEPIITA